MMDSGHAEEHLARFLLMHRVKKPPSSSASLTIIVLFAGRRKELSPELLEKFTQFALGQGLTLENILILPRTSKNKLEIWDMAEGGLE